MDVLTKFSSKLSTFFGRSLRYYSHRTYQKIDLGYFVFFETPYCPFYIFAFWFTWIVFHRACKCTKAHLPWLAAPWISCCFNSGFRSDQKFLNLNNVLKTNHAVPLVNGSLHQQELQGENNGKYILVRIIRYGARWWPGLMQSYGLVTTPHPSPSASCSILSPQLAEGAQGSTFHWSVKYVDKLNHEK